LIRHTCPSEYNLDDTADQPTVASGLIELSEEVVAVDGWGRVVHIGTQERRAGNERAAALACDDVDECARKGVRKPQALLASPLDFEAEGRIVDAHVPPIDNSLELLHGIEDEV
jgi:hypothetical protein